MRRSSNPNQSFDGNPCFLPSGEPVPSADLPEIVRTIQNGQNTVLVSISGKDSLASWLFLVEQGFTVVPYFCYSVPHLSFDDEWIEYLEHRFQTHVYRFLHPASVAMLEACYWQPPERVGLLLRMQLQRIDYTFLESQVVRAENLSPLTFSAVGIRAADNLMRHRLVHQMGPLGLKKRRYWWAVWDFSYDDVLAIIRKHGAKLSRSYEIWGATGDIWDYWALKLLKQKSPDDFSRMLEMFPLIEAELYKYERVTKWTDRNRR